MASLARAIAGLAAQVRPTGRRLGTVQAIDTSTGTLTVAMGGDDVHGIPWQASSYSPVVGDRVSILWDQNAGMLVTGTISTVRVADPEQVTVEISPHLECDIIFRDGFDTQWYWDRGRNQDQYGYALNQGRGHDGFTDRWIRHCTYVEYPPLSSVIPSGASSINISARLIRSATDWNNNLELPLVSPAIYAHATPLPTSGGPGPDPYFATDAYRPGALTFGDEVIYPLPPEWQEGLLDGSLTGIATYSEAVQDFALFLRSNEQGQGVAGNNAHLVISYTPPAGE